MARDNANGTGHTGFGWLRAAVLGAIEGIVSTASLVVDVAVAKSSSGRCTRLTLLTVRASCKNANGVAGGTKVDFSRRQRGL
jgi:hypothetical protein